MRRTAARPLRVPRQALRRRSGMVLAAVRPIVQEAAAALGLVVWDLAFRREAGRDVLRVAVDRPGGVDSESITALAEALSRSLDAADAVPGEGSYVLEVTSPGAERPLSSPEQFRICVGRPVRITFRDGREPVEGTLAAASGEDVTVERPGGEPLRIGYEEISRARLWVPGR